LKFSWVRLVSSGSPCLISSPFIFFVVIADFLSYIYHCFVEVKNGVFIFFISH
jgi:hypothetical protein